MSCLRDLPRPDTKNRGIVRGKATLWEVDPQEQFVQQAEGLLEQIVVDACVQLDASVRLYDAFLPLLTEDIRTQQFIQEEHSREEYLAEVKRLQDLELQMRNTCPNLLRMMLKIYLDSFRAIIVRQSMYVKSSHELLMAQDSMNSSPVMGRR